MHDIIGGNGVKKLNHYGKNFGTRHTLLIFFAANANGIISNMIVHVAKTVQTSLDNVLESYHAPNVFHMVNQTYMEFYYVPIIGKNIRLEKQKKTIMHCNRYGQEHDTPLRVYLKVSSALMFIPAIISLKTQPIIFSVVLFMAAIFSTLYHLSDEANHATSDEIWASLTLMLILVMSLRLAAELGFFHWRVVSIFAFGITAIVAYMTHGCRNDTTVTSHEYEMWHSIWHTFAAAAATLVIIKRSDISFKSDDSFVTWIQESYQKSKENLNQWQQ